MKIYELVKTERLLMSVVKSKLPKKKKKKRKIKKKKKENTG